MARSETAPPSPRSGVTCALNCFHSVTTPAGTPAASGSRGDALCA